MAIQVSVRAALAAIAAAHPELAVTVELGSQSATGVRVLTDKQTEPGAFGQAGTKIHTVRVSSAEIDEPDRGAHLTIDDQQVYVLGASESGGVWRFECSDTQPVEGV